MTRTWKPIVAAVALGLAAACATTQRIDAAGDVHALLIAIRDDDHAAFDRTSTARRWSTRWKRGSSIQRSGKGPAT